jgi:hypothetical protein
MKYEIELNKEEIKNLKRIRSYFGEHDKLLIEHTAYAMLDKLVKNLTVPVVSISLPSNEEIREPIQNALYATDILTTDQCTELADGILTYLNEVGYKVVRQSNVGVCFDRPIVAQKITNDI